MTFRARLHIGPFEEGGEPEEWLSGPVECGGCGYRWVAVRPSDVMLLECPKCGQALGSMPHTAKDVGDDLHRLVGHN